MLLQRAAPLRLHQGHIVVTQAEDVRSCFQKWSQPSLVRQEHKTVICDSSMDACMHIEEATKARKLAFANSPVVAFTNVPRWVPECAGSL